MFIHYDPIKTLEEQAKSHEERLEYLRGIDPSRRCEDDVREIEFTDEALIQFRLSIDILKRALEPKKEAAYEHVRISLSDLSGKNRLKEACKTVDEIKSRFTLSSKTAKEIVNAYLSLIGSSKI